MPRIGISAPLRLVQLAFEPARLASEVKWADLAELRVEDYSVGMTVPTFEEPRDVPPGSPDWSAS